MSRLALAALWAPLAFGMARTPAPKSEPAEVQMEWEGIHSGVSAQRTEIVVEKAKWDALWQAAFGKDAPEVDFSKRFAVAVFAGAKPTGGYKIELGRRGPDAITWSVRGPAQKSFVIQAFTEPYKIAVLDGDGRLMRLVPLE
jgi:hypothetical protein